MKKTILLFIVALLSIASLYSQNEEDIYKEKKTLFGAKFGFTKSEKNTNVLQFSSLYFGFFSETKISNKFRLQAEVNMNMPSGSVFKNFSNAEFQVPVLMKYYLNDKISIYAGPQLDVYQYDIRLNNNIDQLTLKLSGVIGTQFDISKRFFIEGRYNFRKSDSYKSFRSTDDFKIGVGFKF